MGGTESDNATRTETRARLRGAVIATALGVSLFASSAMAQDPQPAITAEEQSARRVLISRAQAAAGAGNTADALDNAERAGAILWSASLRLFAAQQTALLNRPADSFAHSEMCIKDATMIVNVGTTAERNGWANLCRQINAQQSARVGYLEVNVPRSVPNTSLTVNSKSIQATLYGLPLPVNPGEVKVEVSAPGRTTFTWTGNVAVGATQRLTAVLPEDPSARTQPPPPQPPQPPQPPPTPVVETPVAPPPPPRGPNGAGIGLLAGGGALLVGAGISLVFAFTANVDGCVAMSDMQGPFTLCNMPNKEGDIAQRNNGVLVGSIMGGLGVVSLVVGGIIMGSSGGSARATTSPRAMVLPDMVPGGGGLRLVGQF